MPVLTADIWETVTQPQINNHLPAGAWEHSRLLCISTSCQCVDVYASCRCEIALLPLSPPSGNPHGSLRNRGAGTFPLVGHTDVGQEAAEHQERQQEEDHVPL